MPGTYFIGADGGGTRTTAVLISAQGEILNVRKGDGLNWHTLGMDRARENMKSIISSLTASLPDGEVIIGAGMSSLDDEATPGQISAFCADSFDPESLFMHSDAYAALMGASLGESGILAICGTGSMIVKIDENGKQIPAGGWGYLLGDDGSSYSIAISGMRAAISHWEGTGVPTALSDALTEFFHLETPRQLIDRIYDPSTKPSDIAKFAKTVLELAYQGDPASRQIIDSQMHALSETLIKLAGDMPLPCVWLFGGVFEHNPWVVHLLEAKLSSHIPGIRASLVPLPPAVGAAIYAMKKKNMLTPEVISNIQNTYKEWNF